MPITTYIIKSKCFHYTEHRTELYKVRSNVFIGQLGFKYKIIEYLPLEINEAIFL